MCLGIPGKLVEITDTDPITRSGKISFGGIIKQISLAYVPEAKVDDYVIIHAGFAISTLNEKEAQEVFRYIDEINAVDLSEGDRPTAGV